MVGALIVVDVQNDFCEGGALPAKDTSTLIAPLQKTIQAAQERGMICIFTRDWHPANHCSFKENGGPWPRHCVQNTWGAEFAEGIAVVPSSFIIDIEKDPSQTGLSYSAFEKSDLEAIVISRGIKEVAVCGIATEYCVRATVLDALQFGLQVTLLLDLVRPIEVNEGDSMTAINEMSGAGARVMGLSDWLDL